MTTGNLEISNISRYTNEYLAVSHWDRISTWGVKRICTVAFLSLFFFLPGIWYAMSHMHESREAMSVFRAKIKNTPIVNEASRNAYSEALKVLQLNGRDIEAFPPLQFKADRDLAIAALFYDELRQANPKSAHNQQTLSMIDSGNCLPSIIKVMRITALPQVVPFLDILINLDLKNGDNLKDIEKFIADGKLRQEGIVPSIVSDVYHYVEHFPKLKLPADAVGECFDLLYDFVRIPDTTKGFKADKQFISDFIPMYWLNKDEIVQDVANAIQRNDLSSPNIRKNLWEKWEPKLQANKDKIDEAFKVPVPQLTWRESAAKCLKVSVDCLWQKGASLITTYPYPWF